MLGPAAREEVKASYTKYLGTSSRHDYHLAVSEDGSRWEAQSHDESWGWTTDDARKNVLQRCQFISKKNCFIAAIDGNLNFTFGSPYPLEPQTFKFGGDLDPDQIPFVSERARQKIKSGYPNGRIFKALAISPYGAWGYAFGFGNGNQAKMKAIENCEDSSCFVYASTDQVLFEEDTVFPGQ
jgi:hypothetical protein